MPLLHLAGPHENHTARLQSDPFEVHHVLPTAFVHQQQHEEIQALGLRQQLRRHALPQAGHVNHLQALPKGSAKVNTVRVFQDGPFVFTHTKYNFFGPKIGFDLFRFEDGKNLYRVQNGIIASTLLIVPGLASAAPASAAITAVIEVATFQLKPGVTPAEFAVVDKAMEREYITKQPGFVAREGAAGPGHEWLVIVHGQSLKDADASMASFVKAAPIAAPVPQATKNPT